MVDRAAMELRCLSAKALRIRLKAGPTGLLHLAGAMPRPPRLAIVGSRAAYASLRKFVPAIVQAAGERGWSIVSGGAMGIDADAHRAALRLRVPQVAVLPGPPGTVYPADHADLFHEIVAATGSGLLYPHPIGSRHTRGMFASRNRVLVGVAERVVLVQAALRSGSMYTARIARSEGRPLAVIAGSPGAMACASAGAFVLADEADPAGHAGERLFEWLTGRHRRRCEAQWPAELADLRTRLAAAGERGVTIADFDDFVAGTIALATAEAQGLVYELAPGRYIVHPSKR